MSDLDKSILEPKIPVFPDIHPLAIFCVVPFPIVLSTTKGFPTSETHRLLSHVLYVSLAFVPLAKDVSAYTTAPFFTVMVVRRCALTAPRFWR